MISNKVAIDEDSAKIIAETYSKINHLKVTLTAPEFNELLDYITIYEKFNEKLNKALNACDRELLMINLCKLIDYVKTLIDYNESNFCIFYIHSVIKVQLVEIWQHLELIKSKVQSSVC